MNDLEVVNNKKDFRFEIALPDGEMATVQYRWLRGNMVLMHTFVPQSARGQGIASILARHVLEHAKTNHLKVIVYCPFIAEYLKQHPEYQELVANTTT